MAPERLKFFSPLKELRLPAGPHRPGLLRRTHCYKSLAAPHLRCNERQMQPLQPPHAVVCIAPNRPPLRRFPLLRPPPVSQSKRPCLLMPSVAAFGRPCGVDLLPQRPARLLCFVRAGRTTRLCSLR